MLQAVFYARFHTGRGVTVVHQYPEHAILSSVHDTLLTWADISSYIIPPYDLCDQPLSICANGYRILAHPVSLHHDTYDRNRFTFNVCYVLSEDDDASPWHPIVLKTARFFTLLEEDDGLLLAEENLPGLKWAGEPAYPAQDVGVLHTLLKNIFQDLNAHGDTCLKASNVHVLNLRLHPLPQDPSTVHAWHVPLLIRSLPQPPEWTWDLSLQRIYPHIDGIRHVQKLAELADVELKLVKSTVKELVLHDRAMLLDIFHFQAIYTCNSKIAMFCNDPDLQLECCNYVVVTHQDDVADSDAHADDSPVSPTRQDIVELYCLLEPGLQLYEFCTTYRGRLANIDIRRFITFGVIKGFLRRVHKYALAMDPQIVSPVAEKKRSGANSKPKSNEDIVREFDRAWRKAALSSGWATPPSGPPPASLGKSHKSADRIRSEEDEKLQDYLDGTHCMDQICVEMHLSGKKIIERLRSGRFGDVILFNK